MTTPLPFIFNIHRLATEDGPGLRSTVFFKGCPLACDWCHNPEAMSAGAEVAVFPELCLGCGNCAAVCKEDAVVIGEGERLNRSRCTGCGLCADACPATALRLVGRQYPVPELVDLLLRDRIYYRVSGGGVTFSGGEPTLYLDYLEEVLEVLRGQGIHTVIQTCGHFAAEPFIKRILPLVDLVYFDLKLGEGKEHARYTGKGNNLIRQTFRMLSRRAKDKILPRIPLIPGRTASRQNLVHLAGFLRELGYKRCDLLPYNPGGIGKWHRLGRMVPADLPESFSEKREEQELRELFTKTLTG